MVMRYAFIAAALVGLPSAAQADSAGPASAQALAKQTTQELSTCSKKGCPKLDQEGQAPLSCTYTSGMATGWQCILICTYPHSNWGTTVVASYCK